MSVLERLGGYNPPDRTVDSQRQIAVDIQDAISHIEALTKERDGLREKVARTEADFQRAFALNGTLMETNGRLVAALGRILDLLPIAQPESPVGRAHTIATEALKADAKDATLAGSTEKP
jgi:hypothetical protein